MNLYKLKNKTLADDNFLKQMSYKLNDSDERASFFNWVSKLGNHWQENPTPYDIIRKMVSKTSLQNKKILVLFNIEFLHVLVDEQKVNSSDIVFISDNKIEQLCAIKIFKVQSYKLSDFSVPALKKLIAGLDMKFDVVFSNPPYNGNIDIKILNEIIDIADEFVVVHPSTWLIDIKNRNSTFNKFKITTKSKIKSVDLFNGNDIFGIQLEVPCAIIHYNNNLINQKIFLSDGKNYTEIENADDITKFGSKWLELIKPFYQNIQKYNAVNENLWSHRLLDINDIDTNKKYCQLTAMMNGFTKGASKLSDKFYSLTMKNFQGNIGIRNTNPLRDGLIEPSMPTFKFSTDKEVINFLNYCQTDFVRFCLCIYKNSANIIYGEIDLIPWLDFTEEWNDDKLFAKFDVSQELQDYIRDFLPDYHGIRK
jgi:hypothetical protein